MSRIAVIVPVLNRPQNAQPLVDSFIASKADARMLFVISASDHAELEAVRTTGADYTLADWDPGHADFAMKVNLGYRLTTEPFVFQGADDIEFTSGWDTAALAAVESGDFGVCGTNDDANPTVRAGQHSTHSLFRRSYIDERGSSADGPGIVFSEAYSHQFCDNEVVEISKQRGCWVFARDSLVRHRHPIWRTAEDDQTYIKGQEHGQADRQLFEQRRRMWIRERVECGDAR